MADVKVSGLPSDSALDGNHYVPVNDPSGPTTKRTLLSTIATFLFNQINIPDGSGSPRTRMSETMFDHVASGGVWGGDAYASTRNASMTAMVCYINGRRISISAVSARNFTASKDTYIDVLDNADGTGTLVYTEVSNNAASPSLAANSIRIGIIVTGASTIADAGSVNQGEESKVLPIASSIPYAVTDSIGNLICSRDPNHKLIGYRQIIGGTLTTTSTTPVQVTGLSVTVLPPTGRKLKITVVSPSAYVNASSQNVFVDIYDGVVAVGTKLAEDTISMSSVNQQSPSHTQAIKTPTSSPKTYNVGWYVTGGTGNFTNGATNPAFIRVELE